MCSQTLKVEEPVIPSRLFHHRWRAAKGNYFRRESKGTREARQIHQQAVASSEGIDTLVVAGLTTECCIDASVRAAFERHYHVFVVGDATACYQSGLHRSALQALALNCAMIPTANDVLSAWK